MAGEIFIAQQNTLEEVKSTVNGIGTNVDIVNTTTSETKTQTTNIKSDIDGLKLSIDSINQIADAILEKIGLTGDAGGSASAGSMMSKLNQIISATAFGGGITGAKYTLLTAKDTTKTYTTKNFAFILGKYDEGQGISVGEKGVVYPYLIINGGSTTDTYYCFGMCSADGVIKAISDSRYDTTYVHIFEFTPSDPALTMASS